MPGFGGLGQPPAFGPTFANAGGGIAPQMAGGTNLGAGMGQQQQQQAAGGGGAMQATPANSPYGIAPQVFSQDAIQVTLSPPQPSKLIISFEL